jgi:hypothetical protein
MKFDFNLHVELVWNLPREKVIDEKKEELLSKNGHPE